MKKVNLLLLLFCIYYNSKNCFAQWRATGETLPGIVETPYPYERYYQSIVLQPSLLPYTYPLNIVIRDNGNGWNVDQIKNKMYEQIDVVNNRFSSISMRFLAYNNFQVDRNCPNTFYVSRLQSPLPVDNLPHYNTEAINIYIVNSIDFLGTSIAGFGTYPWLNGYRDVILIKKDELMNASQVELLVHEIGHLFGLYHTFGPWSVFPSEDGLSDTDYDSEIEGTNLACVAGGSGKSLNNIMSYNIGNASCKSREFTWKQENLMRKVAETSADDNLGGKFGRLGDFSGPCETINFGNFPTITVGNGNVKHIIRTTGNVNLNAYNNLSKMEVLSTTFTATSWAHNSVDGTVILKATPCAGDMPNRSSNNFGQQNNSEENLVGLKPYPNPFSDYIRLPNKGIKKITIYNSIGLLIETINPHPQSHEIIWKTNGISIGAYIVNVSYSDGRNKSFKIVKATY